MNLNDELRNVILVVDAEPAEVDACREILAAEPFRFLTAATGSEARRLLKLHSDEVAAVLLDWNLPKTKVGNLLRWMKKSPVLSDIEVILESEEFVPNDIDQGIAQGAYYYLTKPYEESQLSAIVEAAITSYQLKKQLQQEIDERRDAFLLLSMGVFKVKTIQQAKSVAVRIAKTCGQEDAGLGLFELLVNAIEHGNLGIGYEEKGRLIDEGKLEAETNRRLELPKYRARRVEITMKRHADKIEVQIVDQGRGFDFQKYRTLDAKRVFDSHGRGILLAHEALDLEYMPPGNKVRVRLPI